MIFPVFLFWSKHVSTSVTGQGNFFCLYCSATRDYEQRRWQLVRHFQGFRTGDGKSGEFVICLTCGSTFDLECLDENSTAELHELLVTPPQRSAQIARRGPQGADAPTRLEGAQQQLSGYSPTRRH